MAVRTLGAVSSLSELGICKARHSRAVCGKLPCQAYTCGTQLTVMQCKFCCMFTYATVMLQSVYTYIKGTHSDLVQGVPGFGIHMRT